MVILRWSNGGLMVILWWSYGCWEFPFYNEFSINVVDRRSRVFSDEYIKEFICILLS